MFLLGLFSGILIMSAVFAVFYYLGKTMRAERVAEDNFKDELLLKALPVYQQALAIFNTTEVDPKKLASLLFIATLVENELEDALLPSPSTKIN